MASDLVNISAAIVSKLQGVSGLNGVYDYEPDKPTSGQYPFATVTWLREEGQFADTIRNIRTHIFAVRVYQERTGAAFGNSKAETLIRTICDSILTVFDADTTLGGTVKFVKPLKTNLNYVNREIGDVRVAEFLLDCVTVVPSST